MVSSIMRIVEITAAGMLCAIVFDQWATHGVYFHAFETTVRVAGRLMP